MKETVFLNGSKKEVVNHERYTKDFGKGIFKQTVVVDRYDLDDKKTYLVVDTKFIEYNSVKKKLDEFLKNFDVKVD